MRKPVTKPTPKTKKTAFVPRSLFLKALAASSVIPLCACGGSVANPPAQGVAAMAFDAGHDANHNYPDGTIFSVAQRAFDAGVDTGIIATVAACCFDATFGVAADAFGVADVGFGVAADAFAPDVFLGVGAPAFDGSVDSGGNNPDTGS